MKKSLKKDSSMLNDEIRVRCTSAFKRDAEKVALANGMDLSNLVRLLLSKVIAKGEIT